MSSSTNPKDIIDSIEQSLEYGRDSVAEKIDNLPYEQFWEDRDEAVEYVNNRMSETYWNDRFDSEEDAVYHFAITEQTNSLEKPEGTIQPDGPASPF